MNGGHIKYNRKYSSGKMSLSDRQWFSGVLCEIWEGRGQHEGKVILTSMKNCVKTLNANA